MRILRIVVALVAAAMVFAFNSAASASTDRVQAACSNGFVGLTYDDGPTPSTTMPLLNALRAGGARATFFIWGQHAQQNPNLLRAEQSAGMWIANHTFTHPHLPQIGEPAAFNEINQTQTTIRQITGLTPTLFRPPFGETNAQIRNDEARLGLTEVLWTVDSRDWAGASTAQIVQAASTLQPGGIILMHDAGFQTTVQAVPQILSGLSARGLCPGKIVFTPMNISGAGQVFHAIAVAP
jgi:peptidoglycan/xylan/chitin deacetylase (PgdA/CDA1 family)